jgi:hypothetical protein
MASSKRRKNKKLHQRRRKARQSSTGRPAGRATLSVPLVAEPSESDYILVFIAEPELGLPETTLAQLQTLAAELPFEAAMLNVALLQARIEPVLNNPAGHWQVAQAFYADRPERLERYQRILRVRPKRIIFSTQALTLLMRLLIDSAADEPSRDLTPTERIQLQNAVLGAHSAMETALEALPLPRRDNRLAYELQAATFFRRPLLLEEMARHRELLRLATIDERLIGSGNRVPVDAWLAASGMTAEEQWAVGFGLSAITNAFGDSIHPRALAEHVDDLLVKLGLAATARALPAISSSRAEFRASFSVLGGGSESLGWELRPFKATPFLRLISGDLLLLAPPWLLSWLGEGFHYRAMTHAQRSEGAEISGKYTRFAGEVVERYALDLVEAAAPTSVRVMGEQTYGKGGGRRTSDVAIVCGSDLILFEVHARRVAATAAVTGTVADATLEVSRLLVEKIDQIGLCVQALLSGEAVLPDVDMAEIERIWPIVVSVGHVRQSRDLWDYLRATMNPTKTASLAQPRVQPLQVMDIEAYEKLMGFLEAGENLPELLTRKSEGPFRERDLPVWLHGDPTAPSEHVRLSVLQARWSEMGAEVNRLVQLTGEANAGESDSGP